MKIYSKHFYIHTASVPKVRTPTIVTHYGYDCDAMW